MTTPTSEREALVAMQAWLDEGWEVADRNKVAEWIAALIREQREGDNGQGAVDAVERALDYLRPHLETGTFAAPDWAIQLASILTGGDGCGEPIKPQQEAPGAVATLPIDVRGEWFDVPIPVHLHVISLRMQLERDFAGVPAFRQLYDHMQHCVSAAGEGEDYATTRPVLDAMTTLGLMEKVGRGKWAPTEAGEKLAALEAATPPAPVDVRLLRLAGGWKERARSLRRVGDPNGIWEETLNKCADELRALLDGQQAGVDDSTTSDSPEDHACFIEACADTFAQTGRPITARTLRQAATELRRLAAIGGGGGR